MSEELPHAVHNHQEAEKKRLWTMDPPTRLGARTVVTDVESAGRERGVHALPEGRE